MPLRIGFYGHSTCAYRGETSFLDLVAQHFDASIVNTGVRMGSEERALLALKKTKPDIAVVFHSQSRLIPTLNRDYDCDASSDWGLLEDELPMLYNYRTYMRDPELERARLYGAALQIEHYCQDCDIMLVNCVDPRHPFPNWLPISDPQSQPMILARQHRCEFSEHANGVTVKGNRLIAAHLVNTIAARDGEVKRV